MEAYLLLLSLLIVIVSAQRKLTPELAKIAAEYPFKVEVRNGQLIDPKYPGTAVERLVRVLRRVNNIRDRDLINKRWSKIRSKLLYAGGLKEDRRTRHSFNDFNHVDLTTMITEVQDRHNKDGAVEGISRRNRLKHVITSNSLPELGPGGSWSTCLIGAKKDPPRDVAHIQFKSRTAFKLVWVPPNYTRFVLVDDEGRLLKVGKPLPDDYRCHVGECHPHLPARIHRVWNYRMVTGSKYAKEANKIRNQISNRG